MGAFGVDLFFVLSSFLITELLLREKSLLGEVDVRSFYIRRVLRIWPLYFAFLSLGGGDAVVCAGAAYRLAGSRRIQLSRRKLVDCLSRFSIVGDLPAVERLDRGAVLSSVAGRGEAGRNRDDAGVGCVSAGPGKRDASLSWAAPRVGDPGVVQYAGAARPDCRRHSDRGVIEGKGSNARRQGKGLAGNGRYRAVVGGRQFLPHQGRSAQVAGPAAGLPGNGGGCFSAADRRALRPADAGEEFPGVPGPHFVWALCFSCFGADVFGLSDAKFYRRLPDAWCCTTCLH